MTNQEAIDLLDNLIGMIEDNHGSDYDSAIRMAIDALEPQWIPCSERLPEDEQVVLVQDTEGSMWIWKYFSENLKYRSPYQWEDENGEWQLIDEVVAWMPLPEPWKGEE